MKIYYDHTNIKNHKILRIKCQSDILYYNEKDVHVYSTCVVIALYTLFNCMFACTEYNHSET